MLLSCISTLRLLSALGLLTGCRHQVAQLFCLPCAAVLLAAVRMRGQSEREIEFGGWWWVGAKELDSMMEGMQSEDEQRNAFRDADISKGLLRPHPSPRAQGCVHKLRTRALKVATPRCTVCRWQADASRVQKSV